MGFGTILSTPACLESQLKRIRRVLLFHISITSPQTNYIYSHDNASKSILRALDFQAYSRGDRLIWTGWRMTLHKLKQISYNWPPRGVVCIFDITNSNHLQKKSRCYFIINQGVLEKQFANCVCHSLFWTSNSLRFTTHSMCNGTLG